MFPDLEDQLMAEFLKVAKTDEIAPGQARRGIARYSVQVTQTDIEVEV